MEAAVPDTGLLMPKESPGLSGEGTRNPLGSQACGHCPAPDNLRVWWGKGIFSIFWLGNKAEKQKQFV